MPKQKINTDGRVRGHLCGLLGAALFGLSPPLCKLMLGEISPFILAGSLYLAGGLALSGYLGGRWLLGSVDTESQLRPSDAPLLAGIVLLGGVAGPVLMLLGLLRLPGVVGSLLLNLETPLTISVAVVVFREYLSWAEWAAAGLIVLGAAVLRLEPGSGRADLVGVLYIAGACLCWAIDNNLMQRLSLRDPVRVARFKTLSAGVTNLAVGLLLGGTIPRPGLILALLAIGALSYGLSLVLDNYALRILGAARESALFSTAPFIGALASLVVLAERPTFWPSVGGAFMIAGVTTFLRTQHSHRHRHTPLEHEHSHTHDDHHQHTHDKDIEPGKSHTHRHCHSAIEHLHPHTSDIHHRHDH